MSFVNPPSLAADFDAPFLGLGRVVAAGERDFRC